MMLVINSGSSSIKTSIFEVENNLCNRILDINLKNYQANHPILQINKNIHELENPYTIEEGFKLIFATLKGEFRSDYDSIRIVAHRFVHGGKKYQSTVEVTDTIRKDLETLKDWAPLHNESCYQGIMASLGEFGNNIRQICVFDTAFFANMPAVSSHYAIPLDLAEKHGIKRYGFHGISHKFLWDSYRKFTRNDRGKIISLHLGNGCSITATKNGTPFDTSMGMSPNEGLIMGTRSGDIDPSIVEVLCQNESLSPHAVINMLNYSSGLLGLAKSSDMALLIKLSKEDYKAKFAIDIFCYRIAKYLGAYISILKGVDAIIFSGGIGENCPQIRKDIAERMDWDLNSEMNDNTSNLEQGKIRLISSTKSITPIYVIATDENLSIAKEALLL